MWNQSLFDSNEVLQFIDAECLKVQFYFYIFFTVLGYVSCLYSGKYGSVDTMWTVTPVIHAWICFYFASDNYRILVICICCTWGAIRLSWRAVKIGLFFEFNHEDYRWKIVRDDLSPPSLKEKLFNLFYVNIYQYFELMSLAAPAIFLTNSKEKQFIIGSDYWCLDSAVLLFWIVFWVGEAVADHQQQSFQTDPVRKPKEGFLQEGLYKISRHPNFFCEQAMWITLVFYTVTNLQRSFWGFLCPLILVAQLLITFHFSTDMTEKLTSEKYPKYAGYQKKVSRLIPWLNCC